MLGYNLIQKNELKKNVIKAKLSRLYGSSFITNGSKLWKLKPWTDTITYARTQTHTHRQGSSWENIFSPEMTEYKKKHTIITGTRRGIPNFVIQRCKLDSPGFEFKNLPF